MRDPLDEVLERARQWGFLGPGPVAAQRAHAEAFAPAIGDRPLDRCVDLGSGGGVPGLVLAALLPTSHWILLDSMRRRSLFLGEAVATLGLGERVQVLLARAEAAGRSWLRASADVVVARSFGSPAVTAECGAPLLRVGGVLVVSEPPEGAGERWSDDGLAELGLGAPTVIEGPPSFVRLSLERPVDERYPRRVGIPGKRPLW